VQSKEDQEKQALLKVVNQLLGLTAVMFFGIIVLGFILIFGVPDLSSDNTKLNNTKDIAPTPAAIIDTIKYWQAPDEAALANTVNKDLILYGKDLIAHTADYFGPQGKVRKNAINGMNCQNCHLEAGTKTFGNNYSAVASTYPKYRARSGAIEDIYKRINDCFERSLNGTALSVESKEMQAIAAYINWLGKDVTKGEKPAGSGFKELAFLDRAANPSNGNLVYSQKCVSCHQANGEGQWNETKTAFIYPPLWGEHSYNDGAGLYRLSNFAKYVKYNMPLGANHNNTQLTDEEAWDLAAFVNTQVRPKKDISKDWPKIAEKPFDHPFGPFADGFSETEHKFGPFKPIKTKLDSIRSKHQKEKEKIKKST
jgi:thiosulfate dehydrogenase